MRSLPRECPSCSQKLMVRQLTCPGCNTNVDGSYSLPALASVDADDQEFILQFVDDGYQIKTAAGHVSKHGDLRPWGITGCFDSLLVYAMLRVGVVVCDLLKDQNGSARLKAKKMEVWRSTWARRGPLMIRVWTILMGTFNCWLHRRVGKFSNDNLIFTWLAIWAIVPGDTASEEFDDIRNCAAMMWRMTSEWQNPFFDAIHSSFSSGKIYGDKCGEWLLAYPENQRKGLDAKLEKRSKICPVAQRKPTAWAWRANPYEWFERGEHSGMSYSPADWLTAYNLAEFFFMLGVRIA